MAKNLEKLFNKLSTILGRHFSNSKVDKYDVYLKFENLLVDKCLNLSTNGRSLYVYVRILP